MRGLSIQIRKYVLTYICTSNNKYVCSIAISSFLMIRYVCTHVRHSYIGEKIPTFQSKMEFLFGIDKTCTVPYRMIVQTWYGTVHYRYENKQDSMITFSSSFFCAFSLSLYVESWYRMKRYSLV